MLHLEFEMYKGNNIDRKSERNERKFKLNK